MKIKDYKCQCGHNDFFLADKGNHIGLFCSYCGKWLKWTNKDEQNLTENKEMAREEMSLQDAIQILKDTNCYGTMDIAKTVILKALEQEPILDKVRAEINKLTVYYTTKDKGIKLISQNAVNRIFDKYNTRKR